MHLKGPKKFLVPRNFIGGLSRLLAYGSCLLGGVLSAAPLNWDADGNPANGLGGSGTWDTVAAEFDDDGNAPDTTWNNFPGNMAVFSGTTGIVALGEPITAGGLTFNTNGYSVSGNVLTLAGTGTPIVAVTNSTDGANISSTLAGATGWTKAGNGGLTLSGANTYTGVTTVSAGTLTVTSSGALGAAGLANGTTVSSGASLFLSGAIAISEALSVSGRLGNFGGFNSIATFVQVQSGAVLNAAAGRLTLAAGISLSGINAAITVDGAGEIVVPGMINLNGGVLTKTGKGTLTFNQPLTALPANMAFTDGVLGFMGPQNLGAVSVPAGLAFKFYQDPGVGTTVTAGANTSVIAGYAVDQALLSRLTNPSNGSLLLGTDSGAALDLTGKAIALGAADGRTARLSGAITPNVGGYRFGGGNGTLEITSALSASPVSIGGGRVYLSNAANGNGPVTVGAGGRLVFSSNAQLGDPTQSVTLSDNGVLELAQTGIATGTIFMQLGNPLGANLPRTLALTGTGGTIDVPALATGRSALAITGTNAITGAAGTTLTKTGIGTLYILDSQSFAGSLVIAGNGNAVELRTGKGALPNVASITVGEAGSLVLDNTNALSTRQFAAGSADKRINDAAAMTLNGGHLIQRVRAGVATVEDFGSLIISSGQSELRVEVPAAVGNSGTMTFTSMTRPANGGVVNITLNFGTLGTTSRITAGTVNGSALDTSLAGGWLTLNGNHFLSYLSSSFSQAIYSDQTTATVFTPGVALPTNLTANGTATLNAGPQAMSALRLSGSLAQTLAFNAATQQLNMVSGGLLADTQNVARTIGATVDSGRLTAGDFTATTPQSLFLYDTQNTLTINARIIDNPNNAAATVQVVKAFDGTVLLASPSNSYSGGTAVYRGTLIANAAGTLGAGNVLVQGLSTLELRAAGAVSGASVAPTSAIFSAQDGAQILLSGSTAYTAANDRFAISAGATLVGNMSIAGQGLASLTRVSTFSGGGQIVFAPGAIVRARSLLAQPELGGLGIQNLGAAADLYFSPAPASGLADSATLTIGAGTPWKGLSSSVAGAAWEAGTLQANGDFVLQGLYRDSSVATLTLGAANSTGSYAIINRAGQPIQASVTGQVVLDEDSGVSLPSDLTFVVTNGALLQPNRSRSLGDPSARPGSGIASVLVEAGGTLDPGDFAPIGLTTGQGAGIESALNGAVTVDAGGRLVLNDPAGLGSSSAVVTMKTNSVLELGSATAFAGGDSGYINAGRIAFQPGVIFRITAGNINHFQQIVLNHAPQAIIELAGANASLTNQTDPYAVGGPTVAPENLVLGAGNILLTDSNDRALLKGRGKVILNNGATLAAGNQSYLIVQEGLEIPNGAVINIGTSKDIDGLARLGGIQFTTPNGAILPTSGNFTFNMAEGTQFAFSNFNVWPDTLGLNLANPIANPVSPATLSTQPTTGHSLLLALDNFTEIIGPLTGSGAVLSNVNNGGVGVGWGATTDFIFNGGFRHSGAAAATQNPVLEKYGTTRMTLTGLSDSTTELRVWQGELAIAQGGSVGFSTVRVGKGAILTLDDRDMASNNRLNASGTTNAKALVGQGGTFRVLGNDFTPVNETVTVLSSGVGGVAGRTNIDIVTGAAPTMFTAGSMELFNPSTGNVARLTTWVVRTPANGNLPGVYDRDGNYTPNASNLQTGLFAVTQPFQFSNGAFNATTSLITAASGTPVVPVRWDVLGTTSLTGSAAGFMTEDVIGPGGLTAFRLLAASEYSSTFSSNVTSNVNVLLAGTATATGDTRIATLTLAPGSTVNISGLAPQNLSASRFYVQTGGIFLQAGAASTINATGTNFLQTNASLPLYLHGPGDLILNAPFFTESNVVKSGDGNVTFGPGAARFWRGTLVVDGGTLTLGANNGFMLHRAQTGYVSQNLGLNGGTLDLGGNSEMFGVFSSENPVPYGPAAGGTLTSSTPATISIGGQGNFSGHITGPITVDKYGSSTVFLTNDSSYTGSTVIRGGVLQLKDEGRLTNSLQIDVGYGMLRLDNGSLANYSNRINPGATINSRGGTVELDGRAGTVVSQAFATFNAIEGRSDFNVFAGASGASIITLGNLTRPTASRATVSFNQNFGFVGTAGNDTTAIHYFLTAVNGAPVALTNNILGPWAVVNGDSFATYSSTKGIGALGNVADGFPNFDSTDVTTAGATQNVNDGASRTLAASNTVYSLRLAPTAAQTLTLNAAATLTIASGGLLTNSAQAITIAQGALTSGGPDLLAWINTGTTTVSAKVTGPINLVKAGAGTLTLTSANDYGGLTEVQSGALTLNATGVNGTTSSAIPGDLLIRAGTVTENASNQFRNTTNIVIQGGGSLTLRGSETITSLSFLNASGVNPSSGFALNRTNAGTLAIAGTNAITAMNTNAVQAPLIGDAVGTINFTGGAAQMLDIGASYPGAPAGTLAIGLSLNAAIGTVPTGVPEGGLIKKGAGMLTLGLPTVATASTFGSPATRTDVFNITEGSVRVDEASKLGGVNAITTVQSGALLLLATGIFTGHEVTGSIRLKAGATLGLSDANNAGSTVAGSASGTPGAMLGAAAATEASQTQLTITGDATIVLADYTARDFKPLDLQLRARLTGSGNLNVVGVTAGSGLNSGAGSTLTLGNPIAQGSPGANDFTGTITLNVNTALTAQRERLSGEASVTGNSLGAAAIVLNGGRLRLRDDFTTTGGNLSNQTVAYGNDVTLAADSFLDANRALANGSNDTIGLGNLTVNAGLRVLTVDSLNGYRVNFAQLTGPGTLVKSGQGALTFTAISPTYGGDVVVAGPKGLNIGAASSLQLPSGATLANFTIDGAHATADNSTLNITNVLTTGTNAGQVANGTNGVTTGALAGALSIGENATVTAGIVRNQGTIGSSSGGATLTASNGLRGTGLYVASGASLTLNGTVMDDGITPTIFRVAGNSTVSLVGPQTQHTGGTEVEAGILRVAPAGPSVNPLGTTPIRTFGFPLANAPTHPAIGTLQFDGASITHSGNITNQGAIRISGGTTTILGTVAGTGVTYQPGLLEGRATTGDFSSSVPTPGNFMPTVPNPGDFGLRSEPRMAQTNLSTGDPITGWSSTDMWIYTGQIYDADGKFSFAENLDDAALVVIDGKVVLANDKFNQVTSTAYTVGQMNSTPNIVGANASAGGATSSPIVDFGMGANGDGWHDIEIRIRNTAGAGGATEANGFFKNFGLGFNPTGATGLDGSLYTRPIADLTANPNLPADYQRALFRTAVGGRGNIQVDDGATLNLSAFSAAGAVILNSNGGTATLHLLNAGTHDADAIRILDPTPTDAQVPDGVLDVPAGAIVTAHSLEVAGGVFTKRGAGTVSIAGADATQKLVGDVHVEQGVLALGGQPASDSAFSAVGLVYVNGGEFNLTGKLSGSVVVNGGRFTGNSTGPNSGFVGSLATIAGGRIDAGGNGPGSLIFDQGIDFAGGELGVTINGPAAGTGYDQLVVNSTVTVDGDTPLIITLGYDPIDKTDQFVIVRNDGPSTITGLGSFSYNGHPLSEGESFTVGGPFPQIFTISYQGDSNGGAPGSGNDVVLYAVPEPGTAVLLLGGLAALLPRRRRQG